MATTGGSSTSDGQQAQDEGRQQSSVRANRRLAKEAVNGINASSAKSKGKGKKAEGAKRRKALSQASSPGGGANAVETDATLRVLGGGQPLVDDFDDADFEARKVRQTVWWTMQIPSPSEEQWKAGMLPMLAVESWDV